MCIRKITPEDVFRSSADEMAVIYRQPTLQGSRLVLRVRTRPLCARDRNNVATLTLLYGDLSLPLRAGTQSVRVEMPDTPYGRLVAIDVMEQLLGVLRSLNPSNPLISCLGLPVISNVLLPALQPV